MESQVENFLARKGRETSLMTPPPKEASKEDAANEKKGHKCFHCKKYGLIRRECDGFKAWLAKKGNDFISFIDESFFTDFPLIHGGLTLVPPCM
jgi:hypothetical protein